MENSEQKEKHHQPNNGVIMRHFCKVCNRGFTCAGALGGHMRAHGAGEGSNTTLQNEEKQFINYRVKHDGNKHSYFLRAKTGRFVGYPVSENPDKKSSSWWQNERGKCIIDDDKERSSPLSSSKSENGEEYYGASSEDEDLANCLVMLSNKSFVLANNKEENKPKALEKGMFQCKACKKVFNSHQALGGHRASHKKVKGCYAAKLDDINEEDNNNTDEDNLNEDDESFVAPSSESDPTLLKKRPNNKLHQCSVCHRVFSSGQALGGHKRCHWLTSNLTDNTFIPNFQYDITQQHQIFKKPMFTKPAVPALQQLDLNFPPIRENVANSDMFNRFEASTRLYLQQWAQGEVSLSNNSSSHQHQQGRDETMQIASSLLHDDGKYKNNNNNNNEKSCEMINNNKVTKLSDLKDMNLDGGWLQMGIASTNDL